METGKIRIDKWLWQARFFKSRSLAVDCASAGHVRVNGVPVNKPARAVGEGDVLTFSQGSRVRVVRVLAPGTRRGPASEAQMLYEELSPKPAEQAAPPIRRMEGNARPTKKDRRKLDRERLGVLE